MNTNTSDGEEPEESVEESAEELGLYAIHDQETPRPMGRRVPMEIDTGAAVTIMSKRTWQEFSPALSLNKSQVSLKT